MLFAPSILCHEEPTCRIQTWGFGTPNTPIAIGGYFAWSSLILDGFGAGSSWHKIAGVATSRNSPRRRVENREKRELAIEPNFI